MLIFSILLLAFVSIGLLLVAVMLRSKSVAVLNFMICLIAGPEIQPWASLALHPPPTEDERLSWIAAMIWTFLFAASIIALAYCLYVTREKKSSKRSKRRRRRRSRRGGDAPGDNDGQGDNDGKDDQEEDDEVSPDEV